jgi:hypothetical protein
MNSKNQRILLIFLVVFILFFLFFSGFFQPTVEGLETQTRLQRDMQNVSTKMDSLVANESYQDNDRHQTLLNLHNLTFVVAQDISGIYNAGTKDQIKMALYDSKQTGLSIDISNLVQQVDSTVVPLSTGIYKTDLQTLQKYVATVSADISGIYGAGTLEDQYDALMK